MKRFTMALLALSLAGNSMHAQIVTIPYDKLRTIPSNSISFLYTGLDGVGTTMTATAAAGGILNPIGGTPGPGSFPGLYFGANNQSGLYTFTFNAPINFFEFYFTAQSTGNNLSETFNNFVVNSGTASLAYTNIQRTAWDGFNLTSTPNLDDGRSLLALSVGAGQSFNSVSFNHVQVGAPAGSVIEQIRYQRVGAVAVVPEPATYALMFAGLFGIGMLARRKHNSGHPEN